MPASLVNDREKLARALVVLASEASAAIMEVYGGTFDVTTKDDASPVTVADERAERVIVQGLRHIEPGISVVAEEAFSRGEVDAPSDPFFLVDPLDGTREFISRNGEFTVNIALIEDELPVLGVIVAPAQGRTFMAWRDGGAFESHGQGATRRISARPVPAGGRIAVASRSHRDAATDAYLRALGIHDTRSAGSSLKFCLLAAGEADIYPRFGQTREWDTAAGHAILAAAGGGVSRLDGAPFLYGKREAGYLNPGFIAWGAGAAPPLPDPALLHAAST